LPFSSIKTMVKVNAHAKNRLKSTIEQGN